MEEDLVYVSSAPVGNLCTPRNDRHIDEAVSSTSEYPLLHGLNAETKSLSEFPKTLAEFKTKYHADVVEWCPLKEYSDYFLCGTYELEEEHEKWSGDISIWQLVFDEEGSSHLKTRGIFELQSGVFDVKWDPHCGPEPRFVVACEDGQVVLYKVHLKDNAQEASIDKEQSINLAVEERIKPLSIDWNNFTPKSDSVMLMVSDSSGSLNHLVIYPERKSNRKWKAHSYEAWNATYDFHNPDIVYSGGDDCVLKGWDLRTDLSIPTFQCHNHTMGVTSIAKHKELEHILASGSYDEYIFLWDVRQMKRPFSNTHISGGGIWKLKWHPLHLKYLLAAAMHAGFYVVNVNEDLSTSIETEYKGHSSLAYGVDWCKSCKWSTEVKNIIASCSFYDNLVHVWEVGSLHPKLL